MASPLFTTERKYEKLNGLTIELLKPTKVTSYISLSSITRTETVHTKIKIRLQESAEVEKYLVYRVFLLF